MWRPFHNSTEYFWGIQGRSTFCDITEERSGTLEDQAQITRAIWYQPLATSWSTGDDWAWRYFTTKGKIRWILKQGCQACTFRERRIQMKLSHSYRSAYQQSCRWKSWGILCWGIFLSTAIRQRRASSQWSPTDCSGRNTQTYECPGTEDTLTETWQSYITVNSCKLSMSV